MHPAEPDLDPGRSQGRPNLDLPRALLSVVAGVAASVATPAGAASPPLRPGADDRRASTPWLLATRALGASVLVACLVLGLGCGGESPSASEAVATAEDFLADMEVGAWNAAFSRMHEDLQAECGSAQRVRDLVEAAGQRPASWTLREPRVRSSGALVSGEIVPQGGGHAIVELSLIPVEGAWKIRFWSASNRELCLEAEP